MRTMFSRKQTLLAVACALALGALSSNAGAQVAQSTSHNPAAEDSALLFDSQGQVVSATFDQCVHSGQAPRADYGPPCNPRPIAAYVAPAPVVVAAAPAQAVYEKVTFDANVLFDFDKSVLRPSGRDTLNDFAGKIKASDSRTITAVGYADRFGTDGYNQRLSERRVATVKDYLLSQGIEAKWVNSSAVGEMQPTTKAGECPGAATTKTIHCLQPDRHVFLEMSGLMIKQ